MVIWRTPRCRLALLVAWLPIAGVVGCSAIDGPTLDVDRWKERAGRVSDGAARGAEVVGESLGTAYRGVREGFEAPSDRAYGAYPKGFAEAVRRHMLRFEKIAQDASFQFGEPVKGFMNAGILAGGKIEWQGWLVDVEVETTTFAGQRRAKGYIVRMKDGEVEEVHDAAYAGALRRLETHPAAAAK